MHFFRLTETTQIQHFFVREIDFVSSPKNKIRSIPENKKYAKILRSLSKILTFVSRQWATGLSTCRIQCGFDVLLITRLVALFRAAVTVHRVLWHVLIARQWIDQWFSRRHIHRCARCHWRIICTLFWLWPNLHRSRGPERMASTGWPHHCTFSLDFHRSLTATSTIQRKSNTLRIFIYKKPQKNEWCSL